MPTNERPASVRVMEALSAQANVDPLELRPLYEVVDPDALDALFRGTSDGRSAPTTVRFEYEGYTVAVRGDGEIQISDAPVRQTHRSEESSDSSEWTVSGHR